MKKHVVRIHIILILLIGVTNAYGNQSLNFDGIDDYASVTSDAFNVNALTISVWVKPSSNVSSQWQGIVDKQPNTSSGYLLQFRPNIANIVFSLATGSNYVDLTSTIVPQPNTWYNVVVTYDGASMMMYINGTLDNQKEYAGSIIPNDDPLYVGSRGLMEPFEGSIDELAIWDRVVSAEEISGYNFDSNGIVAYWNMDEGIGSICEDLSGNGLDLLISDATWTTGAPVGKPTIDITASNTHSLQFDGVDDYINIDNTFEIQSDEGLTASFWVKSNWIQPKDYFLDFYSGNRYFFLAENGDIVLSQDGSFRLEHSIDLANSYGDQWVHIAGVVDIANSVAKLYLNGVMVADTSISLQSIALTSGGNKLIGCRYNLEYGFNERVLDELSIWNRPLSQAEIQNTLNNSLLGSEAGLVSYWNFDEGTGNTVSDLSNNNNNGTIYGASWSTDVPFLSSSISSSLTWKMQVKGTQGSLNDVDNYLGVAPTATKGFDASFDEVEPPAAPGSSLSLYFPHPEWNNQLGDNFSSDILPEEDVSDSMQVWDLHVATTDSGMINLEFLFTDIPSLPVVLEDVGTGYKTFLQNGSTHSVYANANTSFNFRISVGDTTAPHVVVGRSFSGPRILRAGHPHDLDFSASDGYMLDYMDLAFSGDSGITFLPFATFEDSAHHSWFTPDSFENVLYGAALQLKAVDFAGNSTVAGSDHFLTIASDSLFADVSSGWTLWGAPIVPNVDSMRVNIADDFAGYWTTYDYVDNGYTYDGFLYSGEGYWLGTLENTQVDVLGVPNTQDVEVQLSQGWDLLSNPLVLNVSLDSLTFTSNSGQSYTYADAVNAGWVNTVYGFDGGGYYQATTLEPWSGYWFGVLTDSLSVTFPIHGDGAVVLAKRATETGWRAHFYASSNGVEDNLLTIGEHPEASDTFDNAFDNVRPPASPLSQYAALSIPHPEWEFPLGDMFVADIRSFPEEETYNDWIVDASSSDSDITLTWDISQIEETYDVLIDANGNGEFELLNSISSLTIAANSQFTLRVTPGVLSNDPVNIPTQFSLEQNFPNPFNPSTTIRYGLPEEARVKLVIYDISGREVTTLMSTSQSAGYHEILWSGRDRAGAPVSTGLYFARIQAGEYSKVIKMMYLK
ncbi:MAG: T9SS type A sorting domain-containing protein [Candidatus Marinimicrobia bacterium]|nr:T9SS type A sorting domain-containing protein [Candidatus Neomarinimicrobiota bacterium]